MGLMAFTAVFRIFFGCVQAVAPETGRDLGVTVMAARACQYCMDAWEVPELCSLVIMACGAGGCDVPCQRDVKRPVRRMTMQACGKLKVGDPGVAFAALRDDLPCFRRVACMAVNARDLIPVRSSISFNFKNKVQVAFCAVVQCQRIGGSFRLICCNGKRQYNEKKNRQQTGNEQGRCFCAWSLAGI